MPSLEEMVLDSYGGMSSLEEDLDSEYGTSSFESNSGSDYSNISSLGGHYFEQED